MKFLRLVALPLLFAGCAGLKLDPSARDVRTVALVGLAMNPHFTPIRAEQKDPALTLKSLLDSETFLLDNAPEARRGLLERAKADFHRHLSSLAQWKITPLEAVAAHPAFQAALSDPALNPTSKWFKGSLEAAPGLLAVPMEELSGGVTRFEKGERRDPTEALARLAVALGVDAVAVVNLDMAYSLTKNIKWDIIQGRPDVGSSLTLVTKDGVVAVKTVGTHRFIGEPVGLVLREKMVSLDIGPGPDPEKAAKAYSRVVDASAERLVEDLEKELSRPR